MNFPEAILAQLSGLKDIAPSVDPTPSTGLVVKDTVAIVAAALAVGIFLFVVVKVYFRTRKRERHRHADRPKAEPSVWGPPPDDDEDGGSHRSGRRRRRRRQPRRDHRPRNPTLSETGGLPPERPEGSPPPGATL